MSGTARLFDTNIVIDIAAGVVDGLGAYDRSELRAISVVTWIEVMAGVRPTEETSFLEFLKTFTVIPLSDAIAQRAVEVRRASRVKLPDAVILATAQIHGLVLLTRNTRDFEPMQGQVEVPYTL